jgi:hypothetical protein
MGHSKIRLKRKVYIHECIYQKDRKISNKRPSAVSQTPRKMRASNIKNKQKERNNENKS